VELVTAPHESLDPIGDEALSPIKGVVHRYADRALLKPLLACPVYCRFCFRRAQVGPDGGLLSAAELDAAYNWLRARPAIREVILTGGDPLMLSPRRLGEIVAALSAIPHIELLRVHTRVPVADPGLLTRRWPTRWRRRSRCGWWCTPTTRASSRRMPARRCAGCWRVAFPCSASRCCCAG
jgi:lysine 2,3-aminomutase